MRKIKVIGLSAGYYDGEFNTIHLVNPLGDGEYTLCGYAYVDERYKDSREKINCKDCIKCINELKILIKEIEKEK